MTQSPRLVSDGPSGKAEVGERLQEILRGYEGRQGVLMEVFHKVQDAFGYIPPEAIGPIARALRMHPPTVYGTLTFYTELRTSPPPAVEIDICLGPTCHLKGAEVIKEVLERNLSLDDQGHSPEHTFGLRVVQCAGHCHLAPLLYINGAVRGNVDIAGARTLVEEARARAESVEGPRH